MLLVSDRLFVPDVHRLGITDAVVKALWQSLAGLPSSLLRAVGVVEGGWSLLDVAAPRVVAKP